ncbi:MAG: glutamine amidotransferase [Oleispira sp.]|jgi:glutamine amidotransferase
MIAIIDYGSGNIKAIKNIYKTLKIECKFVSEPNQLIGVDKIILPGVGAFDEAMTQLNKSGLREVLDSMVLEQEVPVLGVCVGMQIMAESSDEGKLDGLGWFDAKVKLFDESIFNHKPKLPHMGWNEIQPKRESRILTSIDFEKGYYFLHSYYFECHDEKDVLAITEYGDVFHCAINKNNIYGFQFHPEKSHSNGINLFKNFAEL